MSNIVIIGGGYTGLSAAYDLKKSGHEVTILESDTQVGGLASSFKLANGCQVEKFYHHWFTSDYAIIDFIKDLGLSSSLTNKASNTGLFYANSIFRLSSPLDLLKFTPLPLIDRIRTGLMALYARKIKNWQPLENELASDWIKRVGGKKGYELIWEPLFRGKFGDEADNISAVWFWNKLKLRGSSRSNKGSEELLYYNGGFGALTDEINDKLVELGVKILTSAKVSELDVSDNVVNSITYTDKEGNNSSIQADKVLCTVPLPIYTKLVSDYVPKDYLEQCNKIRFLGNTCLVLQLNKSLSDTYWMNVADPTFPFVGIIEHTNFDSMENYGGERIAYISKYLSTKDDLFKMSREEYFNYCIPHIQKIVPEFDASWVNDYAIWKSEYSQPVIVKNYSKLIPDNKTPISNLWLSTMAQIYPEDRGTNYAVKTGRKIAAQMT